MRTHLKNEPESVWGFSLGLFYYNKKFCFLGRVLKAMAKE
jgi:hypothetical protein